MIIIKNTTITILYKKGDNYHFLEWQRYIKNNPQPYSKISNYLITLKSICTNYFCNNLFYINQWRLPTINEIQNIYKIHNTFGIFLNRICFGFHQNANGTNLTNTVWTSTKDNKNEKYTLVFDTSCGEILSFTTSKCPHIVRAVCNALQGDVK